MSAIRCFAGIPLQESTVRPILAVCDAIRDKDPSWRDEKWVASENLHVTVKYLGSVEDDDLTPLLQAIQDEVSGVPAFELAFDGIRARPNRRRCRMLWAAFLDPSGEASRLSAAIDAAIGRFGIVPDERDYRPHATLCRARRLRTVSAEALSEADRIASRSVPELMSVPSVSVFSSRLTPRGPIYCEIGAWRLGGR